MIRVKGGRQLRVALTAARVMAEKDFSAMFRELSLFLHRDLIMLTPRDTGWASQHWSLGLNRTTEAVATNVDSLGSVKSGDVVSAYNNVPYIGLLDTGYSLQRPSGFTHLAALNVKSKAAISSIKLSTEVYNV